MNIKLLIYVFLILQSVLLSQTSLQDNKSLYALQIKFNQNCVVLADSSKESKIPRPIFGEIAAGAVGGILGSFAAAIAALPFVDTSGEFGGLAVIPFAGLGYILGTALGVFIPANRFNNNTSYWLTLLSGIVGTCAGAGIASIDKADYSTNTLIVLGTPIIFEILYANLLVPDLESNKSISIKSKFLNINTSDRFSSRISDINIELLRIRL